MHGGPYSPQTARIQAGLGRGHQAFRRTANSGRKVGAGDGGGASAAVFMRRTDCSEPAAIALRSGAHVRRCGLAPGAHGGTSGRLHDASTRRQMRGPVSTHPVPWSTRRSAQAPADRQPRRKPEYRPADIGCATGDVGMMRGVAERVNGRRRPGGAGTAARGWGHSLEVPSGQNKHPPRLPPSNRSRDLPGSAAAGLMPGCRLMKIRPRQYWQSQPNTGIPRPRSWR